MSLRAVNDTICQVGFRKYLLRRLLLSIPTIIGVIVLVFLISHLAPGSPVDFILGDQASSLDREQLMKDYGLDQPITTQFVTYLKSICRGELGESYYRPGKKVLSLILERLPATAYLALCSMIFALLLSLPLGILSARHAFTRIDMIAMFIALLGISIPHFALGPALISVFAVWLNLDIPFAGNEQVLSFILPTFTLGTALMALLTRMTRSSVLEVLTADYIRTAYAKGLTEKTIFYKHALRNALNPVITLVGLQLGALLTGAIITEKIFDWPGLGQLFITAIQQRDFYLIQGCVLVISLIYIIVNLLTDICYSLADPRIKYS